MFYFFVLKSITTHELKVNTIKRIYPQQIYNNFLKIQFFLLNNFIYEVHSIMTLRDKIDNDYKNALKSKDKNKISTYRLILSDSWSSLLVPTFPICGKVKLIIWPAYDGSDIISW